MDKAKLIGSLAASSEDELLLARALDRLGKAERKNVPGSTAFLTGREQELVKKLMLGANISGASFFGGYEGAERAVAVYIPDYYDAGEYLSGEDSPVTCLRAEISSYDTLTHRDFLGGILGQGIKREVLGDILLSEGFCDFMVTTEIAPYLLSQLTSIGRARIRLRAIPLSEVVVPKQKTKIIHDTVASLRLDSLMASGFQIGRSKAQTLIAAGRVEVDHLPVTKADRLLEEGTVISARGLGKVRLSAVNGITKKDRISVTIERYL